MRRLEARGREGGVFRASGRALRGKTHSSHGGGKAYLNFELKDTPKARGLRPSQILDFKVQIRSRDCRAMGRRGGD